MYVLTGILIVVCGMLVTADNPCRSMEPGQHWVPDPKDCSKFYLCFAGRMYNFSCDDSTWDPETKTCVPRGSPWDKCSMKQDLEKLNPCSGSGNAMLAKSDNCAQYYDCSSRETTITEDPHLKECSYPFLYNEEEKRCEPHSLVKCGNRKELVDPCDYESNQCSSVVCVPCNVRFPSCKDLPDGLNPWVGREWSPFFVVCEKDRVVFHGQCDTSNGIEIFSPIKRMCQDSKFKKDNTKH